MKRPQGTGKRVFPNLFKRRLEPVRALTLALAIFFVCNTAAWAQLSAPQWHQDLQALATLPALDPNFLAHASADEFAQRLAQLDAGIPTMSDSQIVVAMAQLVAMGGDGHTNLSLTQGPARFHIYPLELYWFKEGIYAIGGSGAAAPVLGKRLTKVGDTAVAGVVSQVTTAISHDTDQWVRFQAPMYLRLPELLAALGITPDATQARFTFDDGHGGEVAVNLSPVPLGSTLTLRVPHHALPANPLYQRHPEFLYWAEYLDRSQTLYIKYNHCGEDATLPFADFTAAVLNIIDTQPVMRIVIDMRNNEGGNTATIGPLVAGITDRIRRGLFLPVSGATIIGRETFSSAVLNAYDMWTAGSTLVGEAAGWNPNGFGEVQAFTLPNSGLLVNYSTRKFTLPGIAGSLLLPDVVREVTWADYMAEKDVFLEAAINLPPISATGSAIRSATHPN